MGNKSKKSKCPPWRLKNVENICKYHSTGDLFVSYPRHKSGVGIVNDMYMPGGHDHYEW